MSEPTVDLVMQEAAELEEAAATAEAASNIAFVKYWGAKDLERAVPMNPSISMTLDRCRSVCSARFHPDEDGDDEILLARSDQLQPAPPEFAQRIQRHLDRLRGLAGRRGRFRIATRNTFPAAAGIASSASGFAALTLAVTRSLGLDPSTAQLSVLARLSGSGSAARSVLGGFVEWPAGESEEGCHAKALAPETAWALRDVIAIVQTGPKEVSSLDGHRRATTSPYYAVRLDQVEQRLNQVREAIADRDLERLGTVLEEEAIDLHMVAMSSRPPIFYWQPETLAVLAAVRDLRRRGVDAYSTMDAGANVHVICEPEQEPTVVAELEQLPGVVQIIRDRIGGPPVWRPGTEL